MFASYLACQRRIFWSPPSSHLGLYILHKKNNIQILKVNDINTVFSMLETESFNLWIT